MRKPFRNSLFTFALLLVPSLSSAQDVKGSQDHPSIKRYAGSVIIAHETKKFDTLLIPTSKLTHGGSLSFTGALKPEGAVTLLRYKAPVGRTSLEVFRNYESALKGAGFQILYSCLKSECGDADTFAQTLYGTLALPLTLNQKSQSYLSAKLNRPGGAATYVRLFAIENRSWASEAKTEDGQVVVQLDIVDTKAMDGGMVTIDASAMREALVAGGRVALYGIYFESGKAEVKPESSAALEQIGKMMTADPGMKILVVGHTDTEGSFASNRDLSERRAAAVMRVLVASHGVPASRLIATGVGFAAPVASNRTKEGKGKNRRVELVEY